MLCLTARTDEAAKSLKDALSRPSAPLSTATQSQSLKPKSPASDEVGSDLDSTTMSNIDKAQVPCPCPQGQAQGQRRGSNVTRKAFPAPSAASDVWSLGCLLVELVSGTAKLSHSFLIFDYDLTCPILSHSHLIQPVLYCSSHRTQDNT
jgi:serine/threonine protein kinase